MLTLMDIVNNWESNEEKTAHNNYLLPWKVYLYHKIDGEPSEISRTYASKLHSLWPVRAACIINDDVLVLHTPKLCICSLYY